MAAVMRKPLGDAAQTNNASNVKTPTDLSPTMSNLIARMSAGSGTTPSADATGTSVKDYSKMLGSVTNWKPVSEGSSSKKSGGSSSGSSAAAAPAATTNPYAAQMSAAQAQMGSTMPTYTDSYAQRISNMEQNGPGDYVSKYQPTIDNMLEQLQNRKAFNYNMSEDPLYKQYAAMYARQGKQAMQDTMGQAAALTGGYGSSYATTAGQQAYQQQLNQLNDKALDLYALARQNYDQEGADMRSNLSAYQTAENQQRQNYESDRADWYNRLNALQNGQATEYQKHRDAVDDYWDQQQAAWNQYTYWNDLWEKRQGH